jgi:hypothetical protein
VADNAAGHAALADMIGRVRALERFPERAAPAIARSLEADLQRSIAVGGAPDGTPWQRTKDGRAPLRGAAAALDVSVRGGFVLARLTGVHARHHSGWVKGGVARPILPTGELSASLVNAVTVAASDEFRRAMGAPR